MAELIRDGFNILCVEPEATWLYEILPALVESDKASIVADGLDIATITAEVAPEISELAFYNVDTQALIMTQNVDQKTHKATLQVTAITPGTIQIRAGHETQTRLNEVSINAA